MKNHFLPFLYLLTICLFPLYSSAQTAVPNAGFETWNGALPGHWNSNSNGGGYAPSGPQTCFQESSNPHSGTYCVKIQSGSTFGVVVNGTCTTGKVEAPSTSKSDGYIHTVPNDGTYSSPFTGRPDSLTGWYRYTSQGGDQGRVQASVHVGEGSIPETQDGNTTANIIGRAIFTTPTSNVSGWTRFSVPFAYGSDTRTPQYFLCVLTSSASATGGTSGSILWVDDLNAVYNPGITTGSVSAGPYYLTPSAGASINVPFNLSGTINAGNVVTAQLSNASGSFSNPTTIGSVSSTVSGTITATIPAGTPSGTGYRIRVIMNGPNLTAADNGSNITINLVNTGISPTTAQTLIVNTSGTALTLNETPAATSHVWKYSTTSGGPYLNFSPTQTGATYTPKFATAGTYYIVALSNYPGNIQVTTNQVQVNVVTSSIAPTQAQSLLVNVSGNPITVTETPAATSREWKYATTSGGPYSSFTPAQTGASYTPVFSNSGLYYIVCQSVIGGLNLTSNEVTISVGNATIATGNINGSPFLLSPSAHNINLLVPYTTSGTFSAGNVFIAQLSDSTGSFTNATNIGSRTATSGGNITGVIQYDTPTGRGYRIRVISTNPIIYGNDNGKDIVIDQFHNSIAPADAQNVLLHSPATTLTVIESQAATREWKYSKVSGGPYKSFIPKDTAATHLPKTDSLGTYYLLAFSQNQNNDIVESNEVQITVINGSTLTTNAVTGAPFLVSPRANNQLQVTFTTDVVYGAGNKFQVQLSNDSGSFANPVVIGTLNGTTVAPITALIPNNTPDGNGYRIRVTSTNPAIDGIDNGNDLQVIGFHITFTETDTQKLLVNQPGKELSISESQPVTREWRYSATQGHNYQPFNPAQKDTTLTPKFISKGMRYIVCICVNGVNDTLISPEVVVMVTDSPVNINEPVQPIGSAWWAGNNLMIDLRGAQLIQPVLSLMNLAGQQVVAKILTPGALNSINTSLPAGMYLFHIQDGLNVFDGKTVKPAN